MGPPPGEVVADRQAGLAGADNDDVKVLPPKWPKKRAAGGRISRTSMEGSPVFQETANSDSPGRW